MKMKINSNPTECTLYMTDVCNFSCFGRGRQTVGNPKHKEVDLEVIKKLLVEYPLIKNFCIAGLGEPTISKNFSEVVDYLLDNNKYVGIITNGTYPERLIQLRNKPGYISISLYGTSDNEYKQYTKVAAFNEIIENFFLLKKHFENVGFSYILNKDNYKTLDSILELCDKLKPKFLNLVNYLSYDSYESINTHKIICLDDTEIVQYIEQRCKSRNYINAHPVYWDKSNKNYNCASYENVINVDGQGNIGGCQRQVTPNISYGNLFLEKDPYNNVQMQMLRKRINSGINPHYNCESCFGRFNPLEIRSKIKLDDQSLENIDLAIMVLFHEKVEQTIECLKSFIPSKKNIYILNNNSSEESTKILKDFCKDYKQIKIFDSKKNLGVGIGRNYLIEQTKEEWLFFVDNDITVTNNNWLQTFFSEKTNNPTIEVFIPRLFNLHENGFVAYQELEYEDNELKFVLPKNKFTNNFPGGASIVNRKLFKRLGLYDEEMFVGLEDFEFVIRSLVMDQPIKAKLIDELELIHDHRKVKKNVDKDAVLVRYDENLIQKSFDRMRAKYPNLDVQHEWKNWVEEQKSKLIENEIFDLSTLSPEYNFGVKTKARNTTSSLKKYSFNEITKELKESINKSLSETTFDKVIIIQPIKDAKRFDGLSLAKDVQFLSLSNIDDSLDSTSPLVVVEALKKENEINSNVKQKIAIILDFVLEKYDDPRTLLREIKKLLLLNEVNNLLILTNCRTKLGIDYPDDETSYREWNEAELKAFLLSSGFVIDSLNQFLFNNSATLFSSVFIKSNSYADFLSSVYLPSLHLQYLICSNEHGKALLTGGIGSYVEEVEKLFDNEVFGVLLVGKGQLLPSKEILKEGRIISFDLFFDVETRKKYEPAELLLKAIQVIQYLHPYLKIVEIQDVEGYGYRLSQGKKAGIISDEVMIQIFSHGSNSQLDIVFQRWTHISEYDKIYKEKIALEFADRIIFPTNYIYQVCQNAGYKHEPDRALFIRPPYKFSQFTIDGYQNIDTLIYYGKRIWTKGFDLFAEFVSLLDLEGIIGNQIKRIILIGPYFQEMEKQNSYFETLKKRVLILDASMQRSNAIQSIKNFSKQSICVLPYRADNHPYSLLELIETGCSFVCANKGGIPEMIPNEFHDLVLSDYNPDDFVLKTKNLINMEIKERQKLFSDIATTMVAQQEEINETYKNFHLKTDNIKAILPKEKLNSSLIITIKSNNDFYNSILINALNSQSVFPSELYLISDKESTSEIFTNALNKNIKTKIKLFEKNWNYSKNRVIDEIKNDIIISLGANDIPKPDFVERYNDYFARNNSSKFVSSYLELISSGQNPIDSTKIDDCLLPLGNIGLLNFNLQNNYAHQSFAIRANFFKSLNGFEEISKNDDYLTIVKIKSSGAAIDIINKSLVIRIDNNSNNTIDEFDIDDFNNQKLLASCYQSLDKFDSHRLVGLMKALVIFTSEDFRFELKDVEKKLITIQTILHSGMILEAKKIADSIDRTSLRHRSKTTKLKVATIDKKITELISKFNLLAPTINNNDPLVTVIVPTYNRRTHVEETLLSVINQTYRNLEIIVVNDAGEDIIDLIRSLNDSRIKYFIHKSNKGLAGSRNTGLNNATGDYIAFLDDDDIFYPNHIELLLKEITSCDYNVVYSDAYRCLQEFNGQKYITVKKELKYSLEYSQQFLFALNIAPVQCFLFHKSCLSDNIRFDESLTTYEDWEFWIKLSIKNDFKHIPQVTSEYRHRNDYTNMMTTKHLDFLRTMKIIYERYHELVADSPDILAHQNLVLKDYEEQIVNHGYHNAVSIIIVTYNSSKDILNCLTSVAVSLRLKDEVIVVDNNSIDDTTTSVNSFIKNKSNFKLIVNNENVGFAAATNVGVANSTNSILVFLHPDCLVTKGWVQSLLKHLESDTAIGAVGPISNNVSGQQKMELYTKEKFQGSMNIADLFKKFKEWNNEKSLETKLLIGFCLMIEKSVLQNLGMLDEKLFLGSVDLDLCWRLRLKNYRLLVATDTFVYHKGQQGLKNEKKSKTDFLFKQSTNLLYEKLLDYYGRNDLPTPFEIWGVDWFKPSNAKYNVNAKFKPEESSVELKANNATDVSIIVVTYNQLEYTKLFLDSIAKHTKEIYEIIFVDNASTDGTLEFLQDFEKKQFKTKLISNKFNLGFPQAVNQAILVAEGKHILLANNDIIVTKNWLSRMIEITEENEKIGIVGPVSNSVSGLQLDKNATYLNYQDAHVYAEKNFSDNKNQILHFPRVAFLCTLIKKEVIEKIGGLDERFSPGNFEDDDFCLRAQLAGFKTVIAKDVFVHHFGSKSFKAEGGSVYQTLINRNKNIFIDKWGATPEEIWLKNKEINQRQYYFPINKNLCKQYFDRAKTYIAAKEFLFAEESIVKAIENYSEDFSDLTLEELLNFAGNICLVNNNVDSAQLFFEAELNKNPNSPTACLGLGEVFVAKGLLDNAEMMFEWALRLNPESTLVKNSLSKLKEIMSSTKETIDKNI